MDSAYSVSKKVELITPARFLFEGGNIPKAWNRKMLDDTHFKVFSLIQALRVTVGLCHIRCRENVVEVSGNVFTERGLRGKAPLNRNRLIMAVVNIVATVI